VDSSRLLNTAIDAFEKGEVLAAQRHLITLLENDPTDWEAVLMLARIFREESRKKRAEKLLVEHISAIPDSEDLLLELADLRLELGDPQGASIPIRRTLLLNPKSSEALFLLGNAFMDLSHFAEAKKAFHLGLDNNPFDAQAWYNVALAHEQLGEGSEAVDAWRSYLKLESDSEESAEVEAMIARVEAKATD
jgi:predicted Zn-dependent protease